MKLSVNAIMNNRPVIFFFRGLWIREWPFTRDRVYNSKIIGVPRNFDTSVRPQISYESPRVFSANSAALRYYNERNVIFRLSVSCFEVMNKKWSESILHGSYHAIPLFPSSRYDITGYCRRDQGCHGFVADYWGIKNRALSVEVKVPSVVAREWMIRSQLRRVVGRRVARREGWLI